MDFVDDIDLVSAQHRRIFDLFANVPDLIDTAVAGGVDLNDIADPRFIDLGADLAFVAGIAVFGMGTIDGAGKNFGDRGFAGAADARQEIGVGNAVVQDLIF